MDKIDRWEVLHIKDSKDKKIRLNSLNLQNKAASAVLHPPEASRQSTEALQEM